MPVSFLSQEQRENYGRYTGFGEQWNSEPTYGGEDTIRALKHAKENRTWLSCGFWPLLIRAPVIPALPGTNDSWRPRAVTVITSRDVRTRTICDDDAVEEMHRR